MAFATPSGLGLRFNSICNNVLMEQYRSSGRVEALEDEAGQHSLVETRPNALSMAISEDTRKLVRRVLDGLSERDRGLLRAVFLEERDKDEVCTELGVDRDYSQGAFSTGQRAHFEWCIPSESGRVHTNRVGQVKNKVA